MADRIIENGVDRATEAKDLATDAKDAAARGETEESRFLAEAAKKLDAEAAERVLKSK